MRPSLVRILQLLFRRRWVVLNVWVTTIIVVALASYVLSPVYVASAKFLVIPGNEQLPIFTLSSTVADRVGSPSLQAGDILSEIELVQSRPILERVVDRLGLDRPAPPNAVSAADHGFTGWIKDQMTGVNAAIADLLIDLDLVTVPDSRSAAIGSLLSRLKVQPVRLSNVFTVEYTGSDPTVAATVVNTLAEEYLGYRRDVYKPVGIVEHFQQKLDQQKADLKAAEERLREYQDKYDIANLEVETETTIRLLDEAKKNGAFNRLVDQYASRLATLRAAAPVIRDLRFEVANNQALYERYLQKYDEVSSNAELADAKFANVRLIEPAGVNPAPIFPHRLLNIILAVILGALGGIGLAFAMNFFSNKLNTVEEVETVGVAVLGSVPRLARRQRRDLANAACGSEAFSLLADQVLDTGTCGIVLSGPSSNVGCTTVSAGLALAIAKRREGRLLLVEADNKRPRLRQLLQTSDPQVAVSAEDGRGYLQLIRPTRYANVDVLMVDEEAACSLEATAMRTLLDVQYDFVVVDAPPLFISPAAFALAKGMEGWGMILIIEAGRTSAQVAHRCVELIGRRGIALFGAILNKREDSLPDFLYRRL